eukprot:364704-Chlamydomonas_euryale.AAC.6
MASAKPGRARETEVATCTIRYASGRHSGSKRADRLTCVVTANRGEGGGKEGGRQKGRGEHHQFHIVGGGAQAKAQAWANQHKSASGFRLRVITIREEQGSNVDPSSGFRLR